jgi:hypothetical protein
MPALKQVVKQGTNMCDDFRPSYFMLGILYLKNNTNNLFSSQNTNCERKKTSENGYLDSSGLLRSYFKPNRGTGVTGPYRFTLAT